MGVIRFDADGWRARVGDGFDKESVERIASALGATWQEVGAGSSVLVGYDSRRDSERLALAAGEVIASFDLRVVVSETICPTPALSWAAAQDPTCVGALMLTASEKSHTYGGMLVRQHDGGPLSDEQAEAIERRISADPPVARGPIERRDLVGAYADALLSSFDVASIARSGLRVVVDPMHGCGVTFAADLLRRAGCDLVAIHDEVAHDFRGLHPDPTEPWVDECEREVVSSGADVGVVLDGDCDRMALVDGAGRLVTPHMVAPLVLEQQLMGDPAANRVVATIAASVRLSRQAERLGCAFTRVPLGFQSVYRELFEGDVLLGVDERADVCLPTHLRERDGIASALSVLELMAARKASLQDLVSDCEAQVGHMEYGRKDIRMDVASMQRLRNLLPGMNPPLVADMPPSSVSHAGGLRLSMPDGSWLLVSPAPGAPVCRLLAEAPSAPALGALLAAGSSLASAGM